MVRYHNGTIWIAVLILLGACQKWNFDKVNFLEVKTGNVSNITLTTATVSGEIKGLAEGEIAQHGHCWSAANPMPTLDDSFIALGAKRSNGSFSSRLTDLSPNTRYRIRSFAEFEGTLYYGVPIELVTNEVTFMLSLDSLSNATLNTIDVFGSISGLGPGVELLEHGHCWSDENMLPTIADSRSELGPAATNGAFSSTLSGLIPLNTYYIRAYARSSTDLIYSDRSVSFTKRDVWIKKNDLPGGIIPETGFAIGDKGYALNGFHKDNPANDFWEYDPLANTWTRKADFPEAGRERAVSFSIDGKGYLATGGFYSSELSAFIFLKELWEYDPSADNWNRKADFPGEERMNAVAFSVGKKGYVGLGFGGTGNLGEFKDFWAYDPAANNWKRKKNFENLARSLAVGFAIGEKGYAGMGIGENLTFRNFMAFDPLSDDWKSISPFPGAGRINATSFVIGNKAYIGFGELAGNSFEDFWSYDPLSEHWTKKIDFPGALGSARLSFSINGRGYVYTVERGFWEYIPD